MAKVSTYTDILFYIMHIHIYSLMSFLWNSSRLKMFTRAMLLRNLTSIHQSHPYKLFEHLLHVIHVAWQNMLKSFVCSEMGVLRPSALMV